MRVVTLLKDASLPPLCLSMYDVLVYVLNAETESEQVHNATELHRIPA